MSFLIEAVMLVAVVVLIAAGEGARTAAGRKSVQMRRPAGSLLKEGRKRPGLLAKARSCTFHRFLSTSGCGGRRLFRQKLAGRFTQGWFRRNAGCRPYCQRVRIAAVSLPNECH